MKVNISVHGRWHAFELANGLHRRGVMGRLATTYPSIVARKFVAPGIELRTRPLLEIRRRRYDRWRIGPKPDLMLSVAFAKFAARTMTADADVLVGWSSGILEAIAPAQANGLRVVVERGSTHIRNQMRILRDAYADFGLDYRGTDDEVVAREVAEYDAADAIAVPTEYAAQTFVDEGIARGKLTVNPYGVDLAGFVPVECAHRSGPVRVVCVGRVGIQKGTPWLIDALAQLGGDVELHLIGPLEDEASTFLGRVGANVAVRGPLPRSALPAEYAAADIFCLPSLQEGMPLTLLQAMASGLPCVVTPAAQGPIRDGVDGIVVPPKSPGGIAAALARLVAGRDERLAMGLAAREAVAEGYGWQDYADRAITAYQKVLS